MKRIALMSLLFSALLTAAGMLINLASYVFMDELLLAHNLSGGEWMGQQGFGLLREEIFAFGPEGASGGNQVSLSLDPMSLVATFAIMFVAAFAILLILRGRDAAHR